MSEWTGGTASWNSSTANWTPATLPSSTVDAVFNAASGAVTVTPASGHTGCLNLNFTGVPAGFTFAGTFPFNPPNSIFGSMTLDANMTISHTGTITFAATSGTHTINTAGKTLDKGLTFNGIGGTWQLASHVVNGATRTMTLTAGTLDLNDFNCTIGSIVSSSDTNARTLDLGSGTLTLNITSGNPINFGTAPANLTVITGTSRVLVSANTSSARTISAGGMSFNILELAGAGTGDFNITTALTAAIFRISDAPQEIVVTAGVTITADQLDVNGTAGNLNVFTSATAGTPWILEKAGGGALHADYVSVTDCHPPEGTILYCGIHSTDGGGNNERVVFADVSGSGLSIISNGRIVVDPDYPHEMDVLNVGTNDLDEIQAFVVANGWAAGIDLNDDFHEWEWPLVQRFISIISTRSFDYPYSGMHWTGFNSDGSLNANRAIGHLNVLATDGKLRAWGSTDPNGVVTAIGAVSAETGWLKVAAGTGFAAALKSDGVVYCYGDLRPDETVSYPGGLNIAGLAAAAGHVVVFHDASVAPAALGDSAETWEPLLGNDESESVIVQVATGTAFYAAMRADGTVEVWGTIASDVAFNTAWQGHFVKIAAGATHLVGILDSGEVVAWGNNTGGKCTVPSMAGKFASDVMADSVRSYVGYYEDDDDTKILSFGDSITLGSVANVNIGFTPVGFPYILGVLAQATPNVTVLASNPADDVPVGDLPTLPTGEDWVDYALGQKFGVCVSRHHFSCVVLGNTLQGLCVAYGIPVRQVTGTAFPGCHGDVLREIFIHSFGEHGKWILVFPHAGVWAVGRDGIPLSYAEWREAHENGDYTMSYAYYQDCGGVGMKLTAANGSGLTFAPRDHCTTLLYPRIKINWFSEDLMPNPDASGRFDYGTTYSETKLNNPSPSTTTVLYDDFTDVNTGCGSSVAGDVVTPDTNENLTYPINNVHAKAELTSNEPPTVSITLSHNMVAETGDFDHYDASLNGGTTWGEISTVLTDLGSSVYRWIPDGAETVLIRGVNGADVHSPYVEIQFSPTSDLSRSTMLRRGRTDTPWRRFGRM